MTEGNEDETEIADTSDRSRQDRQGHSTGNAQAIFGHSSNNRSSPFWLFVKGASIEKAYPWLGRNQRLAKGFEKTIESAEAWLLITNIQLLSRRPYFECMPILHQRFVPPGA